MNTEIETELCRTCHKEKPPYVKYEYRQETSQTIFILEDGEWEEQDTEYIGSNYTGEDYECKECFQESVVKYVKENFTIKVI